MKDDLGNRMKGYEALSRSNLDRDLPVIARIDGKAFRTFTKNLDKPWDRGLQKSMWSAAKYAAERIQGCKLAYVQSDEISFLLTGYDKEDTQGWFNYKLEKMTSVAASMVTAGFISAGFNHLPQKTLGFLDGKGLPAFDARFFNLPKDEVSNYFWSREQDCIRNSVQMLARAHFSHKECNKKNNSQLKEMLLEKDISWEKQDHFSKYGVCIRKVEKEEMVSYEVHGEQRTSMAKRNYWEVDYDIPIFYKEREYVEKYVNF